MTRTTDEQPPATARVTAAWGRRVEVTLKGGRRFQARLKGKSLRIVCGDFVTVEALAQESELLVTGMLERRNELARTDTRGRREVLAANIDRIAVVVAPVPRTDYFMTDRYLGAAELLGAEAAIVVNKADLAGSSPDACDEYAALGYPVFTTSAATGHGLDELAAWIDGSVAVLVGQSGVGKSSLTNKLVPAADLATAGLNEKLDEGRHTTVAATMQPLPRGGALIDSPGVRDYAPHIDDERAVARAFVEIDAASADCRFADCLHLAEPDCNVKRLATSGEIGERRYQSYRRLLNTVRQVVSTSRF